MRIWFYQVFVCYNDLVKEDNAMRKKLISYLMSFCLVVTVLPATAFAATDVHTYSGKDFGEVQTVAKNVKTIGEKEEALEVNDSMINNDASLSKISRNTATLSDVPVAVVNGIEYYTVQAAIDAATVGSTVKMLANAYESIEIKKNITLNMNNCVLMDNATTDVITVVADDVVIKNGIVGNLNDTPVEHATAIYIPRGAYAEVNNVAATTVGGTETDKISSAFYVANGGSGKFIGCSVFYDTDYVTEYDWINASYIEEGGTAYFVNCAFETLYGDCCYMDGEYAVFENCYFTAEEDYSSAINVGEDAELLQIHSGYYFGNSPVWVNSDYSEVLVLEGEFHSAYKNQPSFDGEIEGVELYKFNGQNTIASPSNWKSSESASHVFVYEGVAAPTTVKTNLTNVKGNTAGYDDVKTTWSKSAKADGYRVSYKKGTGSYGTSKYYAKTATRVRTITNLADGYKYTFKVTPYVKVNEKLLENGGTKCYSNKYKTAYTYTLKKVLQPTAVRSGTKVKVTWKNISGETGYQISKSSKKTGTNIVYTYKTTSGKSKLISATKGKTYYYKVRAYKTIGKTSSGKEIRVYAPWSSPKAYKR